MSLPERRFVAAWLAGAVYTLVACSDTAGGPPEAQAGSSAGSSAAAAGASGGSPAAAGAGGRSSAGSSSSGAAGGAGATAGGSGAAGRGSAGAGMTGGAGGGGAGVAGASGGGLGGAGSGGSAGVGGAQLGGAAGTGATAGRAGQGGASAGQAGAANGGAAGSSYQPCPATGACKIMPFGDSITEGYPIYGGYRTGLFHLAREAGHDVTFVGSATNGPSMVDGVAFPQHHEGHGGYTIDDNTARNAKGISPFVATSLPAYTPDIITLMIGTNDLNGNIDVGTAPNRLGALLDAIHAKDAEVLVVLAQIVPTRTDGTNQTVQTYNGAMPALVSSRAGMGHHVILIDMYAAFTQDADYKNALLGDNLHPNEAGYERMAETWYAALEPYLR